MAEIAAAAPPPPPPEYMSKLAKELVRDPTQDSFNTYATRFADDLNVYLDDDKIPIGKKAWMAKENGRIGKIRRVVIGYSFSENAILIVDEFDDMSACPPNTLCDPRPVTRAAHYKFGPDHLIHELRFLQGGSFLIPLKPDD